MNFDSGYYCYLYLNKQNAIINGVNMIS